MKREALISGVLAMLAAPLAAHAQAGKVLGETACPVDEPTGMTADGEFLWISDMATRTLVKVRRADGSVVERLPARGNEPTGVALAGGVLYAVDRGGDAVDPAGGVIERRRPGGPSDLSPLPYYEHYAWGLAHDGKSLWVVDNDGARIHEIDPVDGTTRRTFPAPAKGPTDLAFDGRYLWVADHRTDELYMVDPADGSVILPVRAPGPYPSALAVADGALWVADYQTRRLYKVALPDDTPYVEDQERRVRVSMEVAYRARGAGRIVDLVALLPLPREIPGQHLLSELTFEPAPTRFQEDRWGQKVAVFELGALAPGQEARVRWQGDFALFRTRFQLVPDRVGAVPARDPALAPYLADERKFDLDSPAITDLVAELTRGRTGTYARARAIYEHLTKTITYDRSSGWNDAAAVLRRGTGSCSEYTFALIALLRAAGIPARYVGAISERGDEASFDDVFHRWAEVYMPGYGWVPVDANAGTGRQPGERGFYFGGRSNRHVVTTISGGGSDLLDWDYNRYQTYGVEGAASLEVLPLARYRPLEGGPEAKPLAAPRVLAPRLTEAGAAAAHPAPARRFPLRTGAIVLALAAGLVFGWFVGRKRRRKAPTA